MIKARAYRLLAKPAELENIWPSLWQAFEDYNNQKVIAVGKMLLDEERDNARRHFGFGGEIHAVNARAVILIGRARRLAARRA
ncbi:MAG: hypothetical protein WDN46_10145 [Methylocella sp.]